MNLSDEIRKQIEKNKGLKLAVGEINNHLSVLENLVRKDIMEQVDEAYQKGLEDGKKAFDLLGAERDSEYQRGLSEGNDIGYKDGVKDGQNEAWEAARKIVEMTDPPYWGVFNEYKDDLFGKITASEAIAKLKTYEENQNDKFEFGDEIIDVDGVKGCVVSKNNEEYDTMYALFDECRVPQYVTKKYYRKTGRHFDIDKILEEMKK